MENVYTMRGEKPVAALGVDARAAFVMKTYIHLFIAIFGFAMIEVLLFSTAMAYTIAHAMFGISWLDVLGAFMIVGWLASRTAHTARSLAAQYAALALFVTFEAIIFVPLLVVAEAKTAETGSSIIESAALVTFIGFAGLTVVAFVTRKDFSFLRGILMWGGVVALVLIVAGVLFGFELGTFFSAAMIAFAGGAILYDTSNVLHHYPEDRYVGASLELFASVALMFWYVLRLFLSRD